MYSRGKSFALFLSDHTAEQKLKKQCRYNNDILWSNLWLTGLTRLTFGSNPTHDVREIKADHKRHSDTTTSASGEQKVGFLMYYVPTTIDKVFPHTKIADKQFEEGTNGQSSTLKRN